MDTNQKRWFDSRPEEELYDVIADPHELTNLTRDPDHAEALLTLRAALAKWQARVVDLATEPETAMAERMWPEGIEPVTQPPRITRVAGEIRIECASQGASIGYRFDGDQRWQHYTHPITLPTDDVGIEAKAVRYGWAESASVRASWPARRP